VQNPTAVAQAAETAARVAAFREWHAELRTLTPRALVTPLLVAANVLIFVAMWVSGAHPFNPTVETLFAWGANFGPETTSGGFWRLLTSAFLHSGLAHLAFNMICLAGIGRTTERMLGSPGFLLMYLTSAVAGSLASVAWSPAVVGVGASGAVFGTFGAFFGASIRAADTIPTSLLNWLRASNGKFLAINFAAGFFVANVDVAAHAGGLVWGFLMGLLLGHPLRPEFAIWRRSRNLLAAGLFVPVFAVGLLTGGWRVGQADDAVSEFGRIAKEEERILAI